MTSGGPAAPEGAEPVEATGSGAAATNRWSSATRRKGLVVLAGAAVLLVVAAVIAVSMLPPGDPTAGLPSLGASPSGAPGTPEPAPSESAAPTPAGSNTPEPTQVSTPTPLASGPATVAWSPGETHEGRVSAVVRHGDRWIAGGALQQGVAARAVIWTSADGQTWNGPIALPPEPVPDAEGFTPRYWINGFGTWNGDLLAFGWNGFGCCDGGYPMLWRSEDGESWSAVDTAGSVYGDAYHSPERAVIGPQGHLVVLSATGLGGSSSIFLSSDLTAWEEHSITGPPIRASGIGASPSLMLLVGTEHHPYEVGEDPRTTAHAWTSVDGRTWTPVAAPNPDGTLERVTWDPSRERFVAVGSDDDGAPAAWLTVDGSSWSWIPLAEEEGQMHDVAAVDGLIVASGIVGPLFGVTGETIAWTSHDGITWRIMPLVDRQSSSVVGATLGSAVTIVSGSGDEAREAWQSWAGPVGQ